MVEWSSLLNNKAAVVAATATIAAVVAAAVIMSKRKRKEYELVGEVSALYCYPIKSCAGITNSVAYCTMSGIRISSTLDRHFVIVLPNGDFITQRQFPKMAGIKTSASGQDLVLKAEGMPELAVPLYPKLDKTKVVPCRVWKSHMEAQDCGEQASQWLSEYLEEEGLKLLVLVPGLKMRQSPADNALKKDQVAFPDQGPYLIATEKSLADVNAKIGEKPEGRISIINFRPNIVIKGTKKAWDEDNWAHLKIGKKVEMRLLSPCGRCVLTTVGPETLKRRNDEEPLKTLKSFRIFPELGTAPMFGVFAGVDIENSIRVGDPVYVVRK